MRTIIDPDELAGVMATGLYRGHHHYEQMARAVLGPPASVPGWRGERLDHEFADDLSIAIYRPLRRQRPVVAFGNTRLDDRSLGTFLAGARLLLADVSADLFPVGVGVYRYACNEGSLKLRIEHLVAEHGAKVVVTGHSLGGALAQLLALRMPELVDSVVTFQSPGTNRALVDYVYATEPPPVVEDLQRRSVHYQVAGDDLLQPVGEMASPGEIVRLTFAEGVIDFPALYHAHVASVFDEFAATRGSHAALRAVAARRLARIEVETTGRPPGPVTSTFDATLEWLRRNSMFDLITALAVVGELDSVVVATHRLLAQILYCLVWNQLVVRFREDPQLNTDLSAVVRLLGMELDLVQALPREAAARLRQEFERYIRHSRIGR